MTFVDRKCVYFPELIEDLLVITLSLKGGPRYLNIIDYITNGGTQRKATCRHHFGCLPRPLAFGLLATQYLSETTSTTTS
jgi:hypothetical protein